ncbi:spore germination protein [Bacillus sp. BHET2]|uniref:spore germination protein n=1 Tax=Bacillus sp. BHET2 TaxID=2583818 RepID=UPI00110DF647|nr:spore germination protein [Bacillus sp. BHET2]TMU86870.1 spore germination protein [Bacillus sp. BHET2]
MAPIKIIRKQKKKNPKYKREEPIETVDQLSAPVEGVMDNELEFNITFIKEMFGNSSDLIIRRLQPNPTLKMAVIYIEGLAGSQQLEETVIKSILAGFEKNQNPENDKNLLAKCGDSIMTIGEVAYTDTFKELFSFILSGESAILIDGHSKSIIAMTKDPIKRDVSDPKTQSVVRGPQEGFTEDIRTNTTLIRRKIKNEHLRHEARVIGRYTHTDVSIMYMHGIAKEEIVDEVRRRLDEIDIDGILESAYVEELIQDSSISPFPTVFNSERPDVIAAGLLEGRVAILVDGTPFVLIVPVIFPQFLQSSEDYYQRSDLGLMRILRYVAFFLALLSPSLFIAIKTFHQELIPTPLMITLAAQREGVPFPAFVEAQIASLSSHTT